MKAKREEYDGKIQAHFVCRMEDGGYNVDDLNGCYARKWRNDDSLMGTIGRLVT